MYTLIVVLFVCERWLEVITVPAGRGKSVGKSEGKLTAAVTLAHGGKLSACVVATGFFVPPQPAQSAIKIKKNQALRFRIVFFGKTW